jgi:hypothetical protein
MRFPLIDLCQLEWPRSVHSKTLTLTLLLVDNNSSRNTSTRSGTIICAECLELHQDLSTTLREQKIDLPGLQRTSRRQRRH